MARQENGANVCKCLHIHYVTLCFVPLATGLNLGSSDSTGLLKGPSEMALNGISSDINNTVNSLDLIIIYDWENCYS